MKSHQDVCVLTRQSCTRCGYILMARTMTIYIIFSSLFSFFMVERSLLWKSVMLKHVLIYPQMSNLKQKQKAAKNYTMKTYVISNLNG